MVSKATVRTTFTMPDATYVHYTYYVGWTAASSVSIETTEVVVVGDTI